MLVTALLRIDTCVIFDVPLYSSPLSSKSLHQCRRIRCLRSLPVAVALKFDDLWALPLHYYCTVHPRSRTSSGIILPVCRSGPALIVWLLVINARHSTEMFCPRMIRIKWVSCNKMHLQWSDVPRVVMHGYILTNNNRAHGQHC